PRAPDRGGAAVRGSARAHRARHPDRSRARSHHRSRVREGPRALMGAAHDELGALLPVWSAVPFVGMLLSIALFPLLAPVFWHHHYGKVAAAWAMVLVLPFVAAHGGAALHELAHVAVIDYVPFIILLSTLFTIGGGIYVRGTLRGTP